MARYVQPHVTQFDGGVKQGEACVPASLANGVAAVTGGARRPASQTIHALIPKSQESDPSKPGWSMVDADNAMDKINISFTRLEGWSNIENAHNEGKYVVIQGDSDQFSNSTCSGVFNGDHCVGAHPNEKVINGVEFWWVDDPICKTGRWERKSVLKDYAEKFATTHKIPVRGGVFNTPVPLVAAPPAPPPVVVLRYGGKKLTPRQIKKVKVPAGRRAVIRSRPDRIRKADVRGTKPNGDTFTAYQRTATGVSLAGSRVWYGNRGGTRWTHVTSF